jgi:glycosyltransferase involved in cell wall biosynthesis
MVMPLVVVFCYTKDMTISLIIPCYNEQETIQTFFNTVEGIGLEDLDYWFINDGSSDETLNILRQLQAQHPGHVHYISLSRNFGKEAALYAGLQAATGDYIALMDVDLQDPPEMLVQMKDMLDNDADLDCVAARRCNRQGEPWLLSQFSKGFYKIMDRISDVKVVDGVRDFRMMKRPMVDAVLELAEYNRFSKGIFAWVGFETSYLDYENQERAAGTTKWSFWSKVSYAMTGFVNFSEAPLQFATYFGFIVVLFDILAILFLTIRQLLFNNSVSGWTSMIVIMLLCFGILMLTLGIIGRYIASIFLEAKHRPVYIIKEKK